MVNLVNLKKVSRFIGIYGLKRTLLKVLSRSQSGFSLVLIKRSRKQDVGLIGCGQFGLTTIGFFLSSFWRSRISKCFDIDSSRSRKFKTLLGGERVDDYKEILEDESIETVFIASNHASHTPYALEALALGKITYVEKPLSVDWGQLNKLINFIEQRNLQSRLFVGYNRPFAKCTCIIRKTATDVEQPLTLSCFVSGHEIPKDHWYRVPSEGTRVCGNAGHWIDLFSHFLFRRERLPDSLELSVHSSNNLEPDDNFTITITTSHGDLFTLTMSSRSEPFEGISETINFQQASVLALVRDFREIFVWKDHFYYHKKFRRKDVGHKMALQQPFGNRLRRFDEIVFSTALMLEIKDLTLSDTSSLKVDTNHLIAKSGLTKIGY